MACRFAPCHPCARPPTALPDLPRAPLQPPATPAAPPAPSAAGTTPEYGLSVAEVETLARRLGPRLAVFAAGLDIVHAPHEPFWTSLAAKTGLRYTKLALASHWGVCMHLFGLGLHKQPQLWHEPERLAGDSQTEGRAVQPAPSQAQRYADSRAYREYPARPTPSPRRSRL